MSKKTEPLILLKILKEIAPAIGAKILVEPEWKMAGQIVFKNGNKSYFKFNSLDINPFGSANLAKDKDFSNFFMHKMGYKTIPKSKVFFTDSWAKTVSKPEQNIESAYNHALKIGFPVIIKPNSGHQGISVFLVYNKAELYEAMREVFKSDNITLVQPFVKGNDYRVVVLDNKIISAYQRIPLNVVGDGKSTIKQLLEKKQKKFIINGRDTQIKFNDIRIKNKLKHQKLSFDSVPEKKQLIYLLDNANLSTGGDSIDVTKKIHPKFKKLAVNLTRDMNLRLCGVDLIINGDIGDKPKDYWILEMNASPGLDHYAKLGTEQAEIVESLYLKILKHLEKRPR